MKLSAATIRFWQSKEQPPVPAPEPVPPPAPEPAPPAPEPQPPMPEPTPPAPELRAVLPPEPEPAVDPDPAVARIPLNGAPREWNVWELERLARDGEARDEELGFLLLELRQFANADGRLPVSFDPVVRESFGELLYAAV
jgi:hypothetical protein